MSQGRAQQDYIVSIRYTNALPPPPFAPKLLQISNSGLSSGQYTEAGYASRLAREQPLNIEADAELGMNIDLIGIPGVFDGNDAAISLPDVAPPTDPRDRALLKPLSSLGKSAAGPAAVTFLRRTEYTTGYKGADPSAALRSNNALRPSQRPRGAAPRPAKPDKDDAEAMCRTIQKSFNLAYPKDAYTGEDTFDQIKASAITPAERDAWERPKHPNKPGLKLLDAYPLIPDVAALGDMGAYFLVKYLTNPGSSTTAYDERLDHVLLYPSAEGAEEAEAAHNRHLLDPHKYPKPEPYVQHYSAYLPEGDADQVVPRIKRKFDVYDVDNNDQDLYTHGLDDDVSESNVGPHFLYKKLRRYETTQQSKVDEGDDYAMFNDHIALTLHDGPQNTARDTTAGPRRQKAAYLYPLNMRISMRPKRPRAKGVGMQATISQTQLKDKGEVEDDTFDVIQYTAHDCEDDELQDILRHQKNLDPDWVE